GSALTGEVALRAAATTAGAAGGWLVARVTGRPSRARTVALAALVGTQLGQTMLLGRRSPAGPAAGLGSAAAPAAAIRTPGLSQFFGCPPLGPIGWSLAAGSATAASLAAVAVPPLVTRLAPRLGVEQTLDRLFDPDRIGELIDLDRVGGLAARLAPAPLRNRWLAEGLVPSGPS